MAQRTAMEFSGARDGTPLLSHTRAVDDVDAIDTLEQAEGSVRTFWADGTHQAVGVGAAAILSATGPDRFRDIRAQAHAIFSRADMTRGPGVPAAYGPRFYGGCAFDTAHSGSGPWRAFPSAFFVVPQRQVIWAGGRAYETTTQRLDGNGQPPAVIAGANGARPVDSGWWEPAVADVIDRIRGGQLSKVVLARREQRPSRHHLARVLQRLANYPDPTYRFLVEPVPGHAFYGATPEVLVDLVGRRLRTVALAGSARRGEDAAEDERLGRKLTTSPKDALEHELVSSFLRQRLAECHAHDIESSPRRLLRLTHVQHLETQIAAEAPDGTHILDLVARFHPTPAVGGLPQAAALDAIRRLEPAARGWYAGAVGWFDATERGTFATSIRSAITTPQATWLYAGAGIVAGSEAQAEWQETSLKLRMMDEALARQDDSR